MAGRFVLTAQLALQSPTSANINSVVNAINNQLRGITATVNVNINQQSQARLNQIAQSMTRVRRETETTTDEIERFGRSAALAIRRFGAFSVATAGFIGLTSAIKDAFGEAINFERQFIKISQVTGTSYKDLKGLRDEITLLSTSLGVSSKKISEIGLILAQAGLSAKDTKQALDVLAKTELSATFENIKDTTEGAIAILAQFGGGVQRLEKDLSSINAVSGQFAVESSDLITAVRRTGGAFQAAGGNLNELLALFTSVRATTRESAESIATGFRTIFTRLQRVRTVNFLENLGIQLRDLQGQFVGPYEAIRRLSEALKNIPSTDPRFAQIIEELGGFRQVSKVIPLIQQFAMSEKALSIAQSAGASVAEDAAKAQAGLAVQIQKTKEEFDALIRKFSENEGLRSFIGGTLQLANALIKVTDALVPLTPLLTTLGTIKLGGLLARFGTGFSKEFGSAGGNRRGFAKGGYVPGSGSGDTVPAMLTPGEFVVRKSAAQAFGYDNLAKVNKYASGGLAERLEAGDVRFSKGKTPIGSLSTKDNKSTAQFGAVFLRPVDKVDQLFGTTVGGDKYKLNIGSLSQPASSNLEKHLKDATIAGIAGGVQFIGNDLGFNPNEIKTDALFKQIGGDNILGRMFEGVLSAAGGIYRDNPSANFDFPAVNGKGGLPEILAGKIKGGRSLVGIPTEVKTTFNNDQVRSVIEKINKAYSFEETQRTKSQRQDFKPDVAAQKRIDKIRGNLARFGSDTIRTSDVKRLGGEDMLRQIFGDGVNYTNDPKRGLIIKRAKGGGIPGSGSGDTVPALLTPGEFVINKNAASKLGGAALNQINNAHKVQKFSLGGAVSSIGPSSGAASTSLGLALALQFVDLGKATNDTIKALSSAAIQFSVLRELTNSFSQLNRVTQDLTRSQTRVDRTQQVLARREASVNTLRTRISDKQGEVDLNRYMVGVHQQAGQFGLARNSQNAALMGQLELQQLQASAVGPERNLAHLRQRNAERIAERDRLERQQKTINRTNIGVSAISAVGVTAGTYLSTQASQSLAKGEDARNEAALGGGLSGAGTGAAAGAAIGSILPGIGTAIGAAVGALVGGVYGFTSSLDEASAEFRKVKFDKYLETFDASLKAFEEGLLPVSSILADVDRNISKFNDRLLTESGPQRETTIGQARNQAGRFRNVLNTQAKNVRVNATDPKSISDAATAFINANRREVDFIQKFLNVPTTALKKSIESIIISNNKQILGSQQLISQEQKELARIRLIGAFTSSLESATFKIDNLNNVLDNASSFASGGTGGSKLVSRNNVLSNPDAANNFREFDSLVDSIGRVMGDQGAALAQETKAAARIADLIPSALQKLEDTPGLEGGGDAIEKVLTNIEAGFGQKLPTAIRDVLVANLKKQEGGTGADESLIKKIKENLNSVSDDLKKATLRNIDVFKSFNEEAEKQFNSLIDGLDKYRSNVDKITSAQQKTPEISLQQVKFNAEAYDRSVPLGGRLAATQAQFGFIGAGSDDPATLGKALADAQKKVNELTIKRDGTVDNKERQKLIQEMSKEQLVIQKTTRALEFLADTTKHVAALEEDLAKVRKVREQKFAVAERYTFGTNQDRRRQLLGRVATEAVVRGGNNINVIPQDLRQDVQGYLSSLSELPAQFVDIFGKQRGVGGDIATNKDLLRDIIARQVAGPGANDARKQAALAGVTLPGDQEQKLIDAINGQFEKAISANEILVKGLNSNNEKFLKGLDARFDYFLINLNTDAKRSQLSTTQTNLDTTQNEYNINSRDIDKYSKLAQIVPTVLSETGRKNLEAAVPLVDKYQQLTKTQAGAERLSSDFGVVNTASPLGRTTSNINLQKAFNEYENIRVSNNRAFYRGEDRDEVGFLSAKKKLSKQLDDYLSGFNISEELSKQIKDSIETRISSPSSVFGTSNVITPQFLGEISKLIKDNIQESSETRLKTRNDVGNLGQNFDTLNDENKLAQIKELLAQLNNVKPYEDLLTNGRKLADVIIDLTGRVKALKTEVDTLEASRTQAKTNLDNTLNKANGGIIYRSSGGPAFRPRGTDTVPAMLTPGEYVMRKEAVDKIGKNNLDKMNYFADGGLVGLRKKLKAAEDRYEELAARNNKLKEKSGLGPTQAQVNELAKADKEVELYKQREREAVRRGNIRDTRTNLGSLTPAGSNDSRVRGLAEDIHGNDLNRQNAAIFMQNTLANAKLKEEKQKTAAFAPTPEDVAKANVDRRRREAVMPRVIGGTRGYKVGPRSNDIATGEAVRGGILTRGPSYFQEKDGPNIGKYYKYEGAEKKYLFGNGASASNGPQNLNAEQTKAKIDEINKAEAERRANYANSPTALKIKEIKEREAARKSNVTLKGPQGPQAPSGGAIINGKVYESTKAATEKRMRELEAKSEAPGGITKKETDEYNRISGITAKEAADKARANKAFEYLQGEKPLTSYQEMLRGNKARYDAERQANKDRYNSGRRGVKANDVTVRQGGFNAGQVGAVAGVGVAAAGAAGQANVNMEYVNKLEAVAKSLEKLNGLTVTHSVKIEGTLAVTGVEQSAKLLADLLSKEVVNKALAMLKIEAGPNGMQLGLNTTNTNKGGSNASEATA